MLLGRAWERVVSFCARGWRRGVCVNSCFGSKSTTGVFTVSCSQDNSSLVTTGSQATIPSLVSCPACKVADCNDTIKIYRESIV